MANSEKKNTSVVPNQEYYAAKKAQYVAEVRDAKEPRERWPLVVTITDPEDGNKRNVYTNVE